MSHDRRLVWLLEVFMGVTLVAAMPSPAGADWGMGMGMGWGMFPVGPSASTQFLNQHAATRAAAGGFGCRTNNVYAGNSNAYFNRIRDNGFVSHYDTRRRRSPSYQPERRTSLANGARAEAQPAAAAAQPAFIEPLGTSSCGPEARLAGRNRPWTASSWESERPRTRRASSC